MGGEGVWQDSDPAGPTAEPVQTGVSSQTAWGRLCDVGTEGGSFLGPGTTHCAPLEGRSTPHFAPMRGQ